MKMKETEKINWKEEINAILTTENIKKIKEMSIPRLKELLKIAMDVGYNYKIERKNNRHSNTNKEEQWHFGAY